MPNHPVSRTNRLTPVAEEWRSKVVYMEGEWQGPLWVRLPEPRLAIRWYKVIVLENETQGTKRNLGEAFDEAKLEELMTEYREAKRRLDEAKARVDEFFREDVAEFVKSTN